MRSKKRLPLVFLDSNVFIAGLTYPRWPYEILKCGEAQEIKIVLCPFVIEEIKDRIAKKFPSHLDKVELFLLAGKYKIVANPSKSEIEKHHTLVLQRDIHFTAIVRKIWYNFAQT